MAIVCAKVNLILNQTEQFLIQLEEGNVTLELCSMLKDEKRVGRLLSLHESHFKIHNPEKDYPLQLLKNLTEMRLAEFGKFEEALAEIKDLQVSE